MAHIFQSQTAGTSARTLSMHTGTDCKNRVQVSERGMYFMKKSFLIAIVSLASTFAGYIAQAQTTPEKSLILLLMFTILVLFAFLISFFKVFAGHFKK